MAVRDVDNRNLEDMVAYLEARVEALTRRVQELELEKREHWFERLNALDTEFQDKSVTLKTSKVKER